MDDPVTAVKLAARIDRHRSTASRSLARLVEAGLLERVTWNDGGLSYRYAYRTRGADELADEMHRLLSVWYVRMSNRTGKFGGHHAQASRDRTE